MIEVVTNLLGDTVEIQEWRNDAYSLRARGTVRAVYVDAGSLMLLVEHNLGRHDSWTYDDRAIDGGLTTYSLRDFRVRVVKRCGRCSAWDQAALISGTRESSDHGLIWTSWEHKVGDGCKKDVTEHTGDGG